MSGTFCTRAVLGFSAYQAAIQPVQEQPSCAKYLVRQYDQPGYETPLSQPALAVDYPFRGFMCVCEGKSENPVGELADMSLSLRKKAAPMAECQNFGIDLMYCGR